MCDLGHSVSLKGEKSVYITESGGIMSLFTFGLAFVQEGVSL